MKHHPYLSSIFEHLRVHHLLRDNRDQVQALNLDQEVEIKRHDIVREALRRKDELVDRVPT